MANPFAARNHLSVQFALLVAAIFGAALAALVLIQQTQRKSLADLLASETRERAGMLARTVELTGQGLHNFTSDYSQWDDMVTFVETPRREWAAINIDASLDKFGLAAAWVLRVDGSVVYASRGEDSSLPAPALPVGAEDLNRVLARGQESSFFVRNEELLELYFAPVIPSEDTGRRTAPRGWLVAARVWGDAQLRLISEVMQGEVVVAPPGERLAAREPNHIRLLQPLPGLDRKAVASLVYTLRSQELEIASRGQRTEFLLFTGTFVFTAVVVVGFVFRWIVRPLKMVSESLPTRDVGAILPLLARRDEIGHVAQAVKSSFEQHDALEEMIEGRIRLGRELHDGVIQTVYAAGMNLAGARAVLRNNPAEAERILEDTRAELNTTIRSLRDFICGLEPEPLQRQTFRGSVQSIVTLMQGVRPFTNTLQIDDELAATLTVPHRLHMLQITREAVSNSVRHGQSQHVVIRLARERAGVVLEIVDDGIGLERAPENDAGRGLANFSARARELGGEVQVSAVPSGGVRITLVVPVAPAGDSRGRG